MKRLLLICLFLTTCSLSLFAQNDSAGFTDKAEAQNKYAIASNGDTVEDGKWCKYLDNALNESQDTNSPYYALVIYRAGKPNGIKRIFYRGGNIFSETPYTDGTINGIEKLYYKNAKLQHEHPYTGGKLNIDGVSREYADNGQLIEEIPYKNGQVNGTVKEFYKSGQLMTITKYANGEETDTTSFDENGNVMKE
jgi:antitoxin component YwqK of YwqJK toxin-antitoxin module